MEKTVGSLKYQFKVYYLTPSGLPEYETIEVRGPETFEKALGYLKGLIDDNHILINPELKYENTTVFSLDQSRWIGYEE